MAESGRGERPDDGAGGAPQPFSTQNVKNLFGHKKNHYWGLTKNTVQLVTLLALANRMIAKRRWFALDAQGASSEDDTQQMPAQQAAIARDPHAIAYETHANRTHSNAFERLRHIAGLVGTHIAPIPIRSVCP